MVKLSKLDKLWIFDLDGTIVKHNGYKIDGFDTLLEGAKEFFEKISKDDMIIILTARKKKYKRKTISFLRKNNIRFDKIVFEVPVGERILINDRKPKGLNTAISINTQRDVFLGESFEECDI